MMWRKWWRRLAVAGMAGVVCTSAVLVGGRPVRAASVGSVSTQTMTIVNTSYTATVTTFAWADALAFSLGLGGDTMRSGNYVPVAVVQCGTSTSYSNIWAGVQNSAPYNGAVWVGSLPASTCFTVTISLNSGGPLTLTANTTASPTFASQEVSLPAPSGGSLGAVPFGDALIVVGNSTAGCTYYSNSTLSLSGVSSSFGNSFELPQYGGADVTQVVGVWTGLPQSQSYTVSYSNGNGAWCPGQPYITSSGTASTQPGATVSLSHGGEGANQVQVTVASNLIETATWTLTEQQLNSLGSAIATTTSSLSIPAIGATTWASTNQQPGYAYQYSASVTVNGNSYTGSNVPVYPVAGAPSVTGQTSTSMTIGWPAVYDAAPYGLQYRTYPSGGWGSIYSTSSTSYTFAGLTPNTQYQVAIWPSAPYGGAQWNQYVNGWTLANAPSGVGISSVSQTGMTVSWSANGNPGGTTYEVAIQTQPSGGVVVDSQTTATSYSTTSLTCGTLYYAYVRSYSSAGSWGGWVSGGTATTVPCAPGSLTGNNGGLGWQQSGGRGWVTLSWPASPGATGYKVWIFDGNQYDPIDVGNTTSWDSRQWLGYPSESTISGWTNNSVCNNPYLSGSQGYNLRDNPAGLYQKTCGTTYDAYTNYWFHVSAYNANGDSNSYTPYANGYTPTLPAQTDSNAPQVTSVTLNGGKTYAYGQSVPISVNATDDLSGICAVAVSPDNVSWTTNSVTGCSVGQVSAQPTSYTWSSTIQLTAGPGTKTEYVKVEDVAGNWSQLGSATIFEQAPPAPTVSLEINSGAASTSSKTVSLTIQATDTQYPQSQLQMQFSNDASSWSGWQAFATSASWTIAGTQGTNTVYVQVQNPTGAVGQASATITYYGSGGGSFNPLNPGSQITYDGVTATDVQSPLVTASFTVPGGSVSMQVSLDDVNWSEPQAAASSVGVTLPAGDGLKTVFARYLNGSNQATPEGPDYFVLDTTPPVIQSATWLNNAAVTNAGAATLMVQASDNITPASALSVSVSGVATWSGTLPSNGQIPLTVSGTGYVTVTVTVTDQAGNSASTQAGIYT